MIKELFNEYNLLYKKDNNITILFSYYRSLINKYSNKKDLYFKKKPLISIIIPLFNYKNEYILRSIMSIEAQTFKNIEIIYINDNDFSENDINIW
jgi:cellulose synthase/poly-beta-1,6-N-acetylglucosamine synthase-like glycosyltransferase